MFDSIFLLLATDENPSFWRGCLVFVWGFFVGGDVLYNYKDNGSLTQSGFLGTYVDLIQDVTV